MAREVEKRVPMLSLHTNDEMHQLKFFIVTYYRPILSVYELSALRNTCKAFQHDENAAIIDGDVQRKDE